MSHIKNQGIIYVANGTNPNTLGITPVGDLGIVKTQDGTQEWNYNVSLAPGSRWVLKDGGKRVYKALLSQSGTNAPVATVLENTLGYDVNFTYQDAGFYTSNSFLFGEDIFFNPNKILATLTIPADGDDVPTLIKASLYEDGAFMIKSYKFNGTVFSLQNDVLSDIDDFNKTTLIIEVYP